MSSDPAPLVSVIIPVYNGRAFVCQAVDSALAQTYPNLEIIVVNDGSPDDSAALIREHYANQPRVKLIDQPNAGTAAARNTGIRHANGEFIALLDQDDRWLPEKIQRQLPLFDDPTVGMVHTGGQVIDAQTGRATSTYHVTAELSLTDLVRWCKVGCATAVIRRDALDKVGLFDPQLPGVDDWDMWVRIAGAGYRVLGVQEPLVQIYEHPNNQGKGFEALYPRALAMINKPRPFDTGSAELVKARADARHRLRQDFYVKASRFAAQARREGKWLLAARYRLKALVRYPRGLGHIPNRLHKLNTSPATTPAP